MLVLQNIELCLGRKKVLKDIKLEIKEREIYAIVGPEESGKSSLCKVLAGILQPAKGKVIWFDEPMNKQLFKWKIGYVPGQGGSYMYQYVKEYLQFYCDLYHMKSQESKVRIDKVLELTGLKHSDDIFTSLLSKGELRKLFIARALLHEPSIIVIDDAFVGIDPVSRVEIQALIQEIRESGISVIFTSDDLNLSAKLCDKAAIIEKGNMVANGTIKDIMHMRQSTNPIIIKLKGTTEEAMKLLWNNPKVTSLSRKENMIFFWYDGEDGEEAEVLSQMINHGIKVNAFYREESDFDTLYMKITKQRGGQ